MDNSPISKEVLSEATKRLLEPFLGSIEATSQAALGPLQIWKVKNAIKLGKSIHEICELEGVDPTVVARLVPEHIAFPLFDAGSRKDDPQLREMMAKLLIRYKPEADATAMIMVEVLAQLTPADATILSRIYNNCGSKKNRALINGSEFLTLSDILGLVEEHYKSSAHLCICNLRRLHLLRTKIDPIEVGPRDVHLQAWCVSKPLGEQFCGMTF